MKEYLIFGFIIFVIVTLTGLFLWTMKDDGIEIMKKKRRIRFLLYTIDLVNLSVLDVLKIFLNFIIA